MGYVDLFNISAVKPRYCFGGEYVAVSIFLRGQCGGGLEDFVGDFDLEAGPCIEPGEDLGDASLFARRLDFLAVVENELG